MKKLVVILLVVLLAGGGAYYWYASQAKAKTGDAAATAVKVERGPIRLSVVSNGKVVSNLDVDIKCKASGQVIKLPFDVSAPVKEGDLLVKLDPVDEDRAVSLAKNDLEASQARLASAKQNLVIAERTLATNRLKAEAALDSAKVRAQDAQDKAKRMEELRDAKLTSVEEAQTAQTTAVQAATDLRNAQVAMEDLKTQEAALELKRQDIKLAEVQVKADQIDLRNAEQRRSDTEVFAPMNGVVTARNVQVGQIISSGITNVGGGTTVLTLSDLSSLFINASVDESDIGRIKESQKVLIQADAFRGERFRGRVVRVATKGVSVSNVVTFEVKIEVTSKNKQLLKPEMTANVELVIDEKEEALLVPAGAVTRQGGKHQVKVIGPGGQEEERPVTVGIYDGTSYEIVEGLEEGQSVLVKAGEAESRWRNSGNNNNNHARSSTMRNMMSGSRSGGRR